MTKKQAQKEVEPIRKTLKPLTEHQREWMNARSIHHYVLYTSKRKCWCTHCGKEFSVDEITKEYTCPNCGERYEMKQSRARNHNEIAYSAILATRGDWQIIRYFVTECWSHKESATYRGITFKNSYYNTEVLRKWINPKENILLTERIRLASFPNWRKIPYDVNNKCEMKFQSHSWGGSPYGSNLNEEWFIKKVYPSSTISPYFRKRGITTKNADIVCLDLYMSQVNNKPFVETLVKMGQYTLANHYLWGNHLFAKYLPQIKIALRNGFDFGKLHRLDDYNDYLRELEYLGLDIHSPKYLCPADFYAEHSKLSRRAQRKRDEEYKREKLENAKKFRAELAERTRPYADLVIAGFGLEIRCLTTPEQYIEEGNKMHHCVGGYVDSKCHPHAIIFSARMDGKRVETIEINTEKWTIVQSRGLQNGTTKHHKHIIELMTQNMPTLKRLAVAS